MAVDWKKRIVELLYIKQTIADLDSRGLWQYRLPGLAAREEKLEAVERHLGEPLDPRYREFLRYAGGWPAFYQTVDLFGPDDLLGGDRFRHATEMLGYVEDRVLRSAGVSKASLLPIAASPVDLDLFVMPRMLAPQPGTVIWLAGDVVDRFPSFDEYFLAMMDYNRAEVEALR
jgi:hypothetical protein